MFMSPRFYLLFIAYICVSSIIFFFKKWSWNIFFSITLYLTMGLFAFNLTALRQSLAISLCLIAYSRGESDSPFQCFLICVVSIFIHRSALAFIAVYYCYKLVDVKSPLSFLIMCIILPFLIYISST